MSQPGGTVHTLRVEIPHGGHPSREQKEANEPVAAVGLESYLAKLQYPVADHDDLLRRVQSPDESIYFRGTRILPYELIPRLPQSMFPIASLEDFKGKLRGFLTHPLMESPPASEHRRQKKTS